MQYWVRSSSFAVKFQSLLYWNTSENSPPVIGGAFAIYMFQSLLYWNTSENGRFRPGNRGRCRFQSLLYWNTSENRSLQSRSKNHRSLFQSLLYWNTSENSWLLSCPPSDWGFNPCCIGIPLRIKRIAAWCVSLRLCFNPCCIGIPLRIRYGI